MDGNVPPGNTAAQAPWMQNDSWASGVIRDMSEENLLVFWIFALVWNVVSIPALLPYVKEAIQGQHTWHLLALAVWAIGLGMLAFAVWRALRIIKFGESLLHLRTLPAEPGGELAGTIHVAHAVARDRPMMLRLACVERIERGSGKSHRVSETVLWEQPQTLDDLPACSAGTDIPVLFRIPSDAQTSSNVDGHVRGGIFWKLKARCKTAGVTYYSEFEVPVFAVSAVQRAAAAAAAAPAPDHLVLNRRRESYNSRRDLIERGITCHPLLSNGLRIEFAAGRDKTSALIITIIGLVLTGAAVALAVLSWSSLFRIVALPIAAILLFAGGVCDAAAIYIWLISRQITAQYGQLILDSRLLLFRWQKTFAAADISDIFPKVDGSTSITSGSGNAKERITYGISLKTRDGKSVWLADSIFQEDDAAWLANEIKIALGAAAGAEKP